MISGSKAQAIYLSVEHVETSRELVRLIRQPPEERRDYDRKAPLWDELPADKVRPLNADKASVSSHTLQRKAIPEAARWLDRLS